MNKLAGIYNYKDDYELKYVNGAMGGTNGAGEIYINFYLEHANAPDGFSVELDENGKYKSEQPSESVTAVKREIVAGLVMNLATAEAIISWIQTNIDVAKQFKVEQAK